MGLQPVRLTAVTANKQLKSWFGYGLHVIADTHYELPVAVVVTCASASESPTLRQMIGELFAEQPVLGERVLKNLTS